MAQPLDHLKETASQTAGPYVHIGLTPNSGGIAGVFENDLGVDMVNDQDRGRAHHASKARVLDGAGTPLRDALIEIWQADAAGLYNSSGRSHGAARPTRTFPAGAAAGYRHRDRRCAVRDHQARPRAVQGRPADGAARHPLDRRARHQYRPQHADVFFRRGGGQRRRPVLARIEHARARARR